MVDAKELIRQLGGNRFIAMTGAKNFTIDQKRNAVGFRIGKNARGINHVEIVLDASDTYTMQFMKIRGGWFVRAAVIEDVYATELQRVFTEETGMYTRL